MKKFIGALRDAVSPKVQALPLAQQRMLHPALSFGATDAADAEGFFRQYMLRLNGLELGSCGTESHDEFSIGGGWDNF